MGKKSKKGVSRANTKKHNASGQGKASGSSSNNNNNKSGTSVSGSRGGANSVSRSCDNSIESSTMISNHINSNNANPMMNGSIITTTTAAMTTTATAATTLAPPNIVHVKEEVPSSFGNDNNGVVLDGKETIGISTDNNNNKENNEMSNMTTSPEVVIAPSDVDVPNVVEEAPLSSFITDSTPDKEVKTQPPMPESNKDVVVMNTEVPSDSVAAVSEPMKQEIEKSKPTPIENTTTTAVVAAPAIVVPESSDPKEEHVAIVVPESEPATNLVPPTPEPTVEAPVAAVSEPVETPVPAPETVVEAPVAAVSEPVETPVPAPETVVEASVPAPELVQVPAPVSDSVKDAIVPESESKTKLATKTTEQPQIWSNTIRSMVSIDDDDGEEVMVDNSPKKAIIDVTPVKPSYIVPIIQTVSPSPQPTNSKTIMSPQSVASSPPPPTLDTPDSKTVLENATAKNDCGCIVM